MNYSALFRPASEMMFQGKKERALKVAKQNGMKIKVEKNGFFVLTAPMQAVIYEIGESGGILRQCDPRAFIMNTNPQYKKLTQNRVETLVSLLNRGYIDFDDVCDAESSIEDGED